MSHIPIGIDLGTTASTLAYAVRSDNDQLVIHTIDDALPAEGKSIPSVVHFRMGGVPVAGRAARDELLRSPLRTIQQVKRRMGDSRYQVQFDTQPPYGPQELSALILGSVRRRAEREPSLRGCPLERATIAVPAYFNENARRATVDAARGAGFVQVKLIDEPSAAALDYLYGAEASTSPERATIAVLDLGGGTFDISVVRLAENQLQVVAIGGDDRLGGVNFDLRLAEIAIRRWVVDDHALVPLLEATQGDTPNPAEVAPELRGFFVDLLEQAAVAKRLLSTAEQAELWLDANGREHVAVISRAEMESAAEDLFQRIRQAVLRIIHQIEAVGMSRQGVEAALLVGGASQIPAVQRIAREVFGQEKVLLHPRPFLAVARGAARRSASDLGWVNTAIPMTSVTARDLLIQDPSSRRAEVLIPRGTRVPSSKIWSSSAPPIVEPLRPVVVLQGEVGTTHDERVLSFAPYTPWMVPGSAIEITFSLDENSLLAVCARDPETGEELAPNAENFSLPEDVIIAMRRDYDE